MILRDQYLTRTGKFSIPMRKSKIENLGWRIGSNYQEPPTNLLHLAEASLSTGQATIGWQWIQTGSNVRRVAVSQTSIVCGSHRFG